MTTMNNQPDDIEMLIEQVGRLTEGLTEFRLAMVDSFTQFNSKLDRMTDKLDGMSDRLDRLASVSEEQASTARLQAESITRLIELLQQGR